jgi:site-specific DNA-cytosine methylase
MYNMKYFGAFAGILGFELAIEQAIPLSECVGISEIDKWACAVQRKNRPTLVNYGDITALDYASIPDFDLFVAGFPCTDLSCGNAANLGLEGTRSGLLYNAIRLMEAKSPKYFLIENVASMSHKNRDIISALLGVQPILVNSNLVSGQNRPRYYWANFPLTTPADLGISFSKILEFPNSVMSYELSFKEIAYMNATVKGGRTHWDFGYHSDTDKPKSACLTANLHKGVPFNVLIDRRYYNDYVIRKFTPVEAERLQTFPSKWTALGINDKGKEIEISNTQRYKMCGNAVTVRVIKHFIENNLAPLLTKKD